MFPSTASQQALALGCGGCSRSLFRRATAAHPASRAFRSCTNHGALISQLSRKYRTEIALVIDSAKRWYHLLERQAREHSSNATATR
ncbi:hypothetical protein ACLKA6_011380 [Drosophila palustris]